jgi:hypothetical protein
MYFFFLPNLLCLFPRHIDLVEVLFENLLQVMPSEPLFFEAV